jgi:hypothetical protein
MPRAGDGADPFGYVGRRVWRLWPNEDPPWVEGFITSYNPINNAHSILYDPNAGSKETVEEFAFSAASPVRRLCRHAQAVAPLRASCAAPLLLRRTSSQHYIVYLVVFWFVFFPRASPQSLTTQFSAAVRRMST